MKYELGNPGGSIESKDCAVRAMSNATGIPYWQMHDLLQYLGRKNRKATQNRTIQNAIEILGLIPSRPIKSSISLAQFVKQFPVGNYYVHSRNHAWCIRDGVVFDSWKVGSKTRIKYIAQAIDNRSNPVML